MIEEAYVSYDIARRLKEKGFDGDCFVAYNANGNIESAMELYGEETITNGECSEGDIAASTQQMAMRWLREEKGIFIEISKTCDGTYYFTIWQGNKYNGLDDSIEYETYELAVAFGLLHVLTKIEL
jgi:hypothetical protein